MKKFISYLAILVTSVKSQCNPSAQGLNASGRAEILQLHNNYRLSVSNGSFNTSFSNGSNIIEMTWDSELESKAQAFAETCPDAFNFRNRSSNSYILVGEMIEFTLQKTLSIPTILKKWFDSSQAFNPAYIPNFRFNFAYSGFTQMVWAETSRVGCGYASYKIGFTDYTTLVCNYYTPGNSVGKAFYTAGQPCTKCTDGKCSALYPGLCNNPLSPNASNATVIDPSLSVTNSNSFTRILLISLNVIGFVFIINS